MVDHLKVFKWLCLGLVDRLRAATAAAAKSRSTFVFILFWSVVGIQECGKCCWIRMPSQFDALFSSPQACTNHLLYDCQTGKPQRYFFCRFSYVFGAKKMGKSLRLPTPFCMCLASGGTKSIFVCPQYSHFHNISHIQLFMQLSGCTFFEPPKACHPPLFHTCRAMMISAAHWKKDKMLSLARIYLCCLHFTHLFKATRWVEMKRHRMWKIF